MLQGSMGIVFVGLVSLGVLFVGVCIGILNKVEWMNSILVCIVKFCEGVGNSYMFFEGLMS